MQQKTSSKPPTIPPAPDSKKGKRARLVSTRDATGHLDPQVEAHLRSLNESQETADPNPRGFMRGMHSSEPVSEMMGQEFVKTAVNGGADEGEDLEVEVVEEAGGPFIETSSDTEFALGTDASNPADATREPFPKA